MSGFGSIFRISVACLRFGAESLLLEIPLMAVSTTFKQKCPSCQAPVTIRDPKMIGKKVECPKCKYQFVVEDPAKKAARIADELDIEQEAPANGSGEEAVEELSERELQGMLSQKKAETEAAEEPQE